MAPPRVPHMVVYDLVQPLIKDARDQLGFYTNRTYKKRRGEYIDRIAFDVEFEGDPPANFEVTFNGKKELSTHHPWTAIHLAAYSSGDAIIRVFAETTKDDEVVKREKVGGTSWLEEDKQNLNKDHERR